MVDDKFLHDRATTFHLLSRTPTDEAYWRGYLTGLRRRMSGGTKTRDLEYEAFRAMAGTVDPVKRALGLGYEDGTSGKIIVAGVG